MPNWVLQKCIPSEKMIDTVYISCGTLRVSATLWVAATQHSEQLGRCHPTGPLSAKIHKSHFIDESTWCQNICKQRSPARGSALASSAGGKAVRDTDVAALPLLGRDCLPFVEPRGPPPAAPDLEKR